MAKGKGKSLESLFDLDNDLYRDAQVLYESGVSDRIVITTEHGMILSFRRRISGWEVSYDVDAGYTSDPTRLVGIYRNGTLTDRVRQFWDGAIQVAMDQRRSNDDKMRTDIIKTITGEQ